MAKLEKEFMKFLKTLFLGLMIALLILGSSFTISYNPDRIKKTLIEKVKPILKGFMLAKEVLK